MNNEKQRIAIAEACGWRCTAAFKEAFACWVKPNGMDHQTEWLPDYLNDLNAMHGAEKVLDPDDYAQYEQNLRKTYPVFMGGGFHLLHATAAQRAEAFLRTIGKWAID